MLICELGAGVVYRSGSPLERNRTVAAAGGSFMATVVLTASGASVTVSGMGLLAMSASGLCWLPRTQRMDNAATPAAIPAPNTGRAKRIQRSPATALEACVAAAAVEGASP